MGFISGIGDESLIASDLTSSQGYLGCLRPERPLLFDLGVLELLLEDSQLVAGAGAPGAGCGADEPNNPPDGAGACPNKLVDVPVGAGEGAPKLNPVPLLAEGAGADAPNPPKEELGAGAPKVEGAAAPKEPKPPGAGAGPGTVALPWVELAAACTYCILMRSFNL